MRATHLLPVFLAALQPTGSSSSGRALWVWSDDSSPLASPAAATEFFRFVRETVSSCCVECTCMHQLCHGARKAPLLQHSALFARTHADESAFCREVI